MFSVNAMTCDSSATLMARANAGKHLLHQGSRTLLIAAATSVAALSAYANPVVADYGDAPDSYQTLWESNGPYHLNSSYEWIGNIKGDTEANGQPSMTAFKDDLNGAVADEEFGSYETLKPGAWEFTVKLSVSDWSSGRYGSDANNLLYLEGWIDFDHGGTFTNNLGGNEEIVKMAIDASTWEDNFKNLTIGFTVPSGQYGPSPNTYGRLRLSYGQGFLGFTGGAKFGEVEDFPLTQACPPIILPEPPSVALIGSAMAGLILVTRRRKFAVVD